MVFNTTVNTISVISWRYDQTGSIYIFTNIWR